MPGVAIAAPPAGAPLKLIVAVVTVVPPAPAPAKMIAAVWIVLAFTPAPTNVIRAVVITRGAAMGTAFVVVTAVFTGGATGLTFTCAPAASDAMSDAPAISAARELNATLPECGTTFRRRC
jgi:hypothetical protein